MQSYDMAGGEVLPYISYIGMFREIGYVFEGPRP